MNPKEAKKGRSPHGAWLYHAHDHRSLTRDRIGFFHTVNIPTEDIDKVWKFQAYTLMNRNRLLIAAGQKPSNKKLEAAIFPISWNFHPDHPPTEELMINIGLQTLQVLGLQEHEAYFVEHTDTPHRHFHIIVNRVHPITGILGKDSHSKRKLSELALKLCREHGLEHLAPQRVENAQKRELGETTKYHDPRIAQAWENSSYGQDFISALVENQLYLAQGRKRLVLVDARGKTQNPLRQIKGVRTREFREKLSKGFNLSTLPDAEQVIATLKSGKSPKGLYPDFVDKPQATDTLKQQFKAHLEALKQRYQLPQKQAVIRRLHQEIKHLPWWKKLLGFGIWKSRKLRKCIQDYSVSKQTTIAEFQQWKANNQRQSSNVNSGNRLYKSLKYPHKGNYPRPPNVRSRISNPGPTISPE